MRALLSALPHLLAPLPRLVIPLARLVIPLAHPAIPRRLVHTTPPLPAAALAAALLFLTATAATAAPASAASPARSSSYGYVPHKVIVSYLRPSGSSTPGRLITLPAGVTVSSAISRLTRQPSVAWAVPDYLAHATTSSTSTPTSFIPDDPGHSTAGGWQEMQWNFAGPFGVGAPEAWANLIADGAPGGRGVTVAVLDTGVAYADDGPYLRSPDFYRSQFVDPRDFISKSHTANDHNGHGTFVAGTIAEATNNGLGLTGLAYGVHIMPVRVLDSSGEGDASTIARGIRYAVSHGAQVINLSLEFSTDIGMAEVPELTAAIAYAHRQGVVLAAAAGNESSSHIPLPAKDPFVIAVGATTEHGCLASYSNFGPHVNIVAPGGGPDARLPSDPNCTHTSTRDIFQETFLDPTRHLFGLPGGYEGTSMACPHVAATAALIIASGVLGPHPTPAAIRYRLDKTARPLGSPTDRRDYGHGLLDAAAATAPGGPRLVSAARRHKSKPRASAARLRVHPRSLRASRRSAGRRAAHS